MEWHEVSVQQNWCMLQWLCSRVNVSSIIQHEEHVQYQLLANSSCTFCCSLWYLKQLHQVQKERKVLEVLADKNELLPLAERYFHIILGSGLPIAKHMRLMLLPSFTVMSVEMFTILAGTATHNRKVFFFNKKKNIINSKIFKSL